MMSLSTTGDLRLTATYGLVLAVAVICCGAPMGKWIDQTKRINGNKRLKIC
jgi:hypothetical protein